MNPSIKIEGLEAVTKRLKSLGDPKKIKAVTKTAGRHALQPVLAYAIAAAPKKTGLLAESLGIQSSDVDGNVGFFVAPRRSFRGSTVAVGDSAKSQAAHKKAGFNVHKKVPPHFYGIIIETGRLPVGNASDRFKDGQLGRRIRKAIPFLQPTFRSTSHFVPPRFRDQLNLYLEKQLARN